jgi:hypothetical protein
LIESVSVSETIVLKGAPDRDFTKSQAIEEDERENDE